MIEGMIDKTRLKFRELVLENAVITSATQTNGCAHLLRLARVAQYARSVSPIA
jgi:hypothetical protein